MNVEFLSLPLWFFPACTVGSGVLIASIKMRPANKTADEARDAGQYKRVLEWVEKLEDRVRALEDEVEKCHDERAQAIRERDAALAEVARLEAIQLGMGLGRQRAAEVVAGDRAEQRAKRGEPK